MVIITVFFRLSFDSQHVIYDWAKNSGFNMHFEPGTSFDNIWPGSFDRRFAVAQAEEKNKTGGFQKYTTALFSQS